MAHIYNYDSHNMPKSLKICKNFAKITNEYFIYHIVSLQDERAYKVFHCGTLRAR